MEPVSAALLSQRCGMLPLHGPVCSFLMKEIQANYKVLGLTGPAWVLCRSPTLQLWGGSPSLKAQSDSEKTEQLSLTWRLKSLLPVDHHLCTKAKTQHVPRRSKQADWRSTSEQRDRHPWSVKITSDRKRILESRSDLSDPLAGSA